MKKIAGLLWAALLAHGLAYGQSGEYFSKSVSRETGYLKAIDLDPTTGKPILISGKVITGINVVRRQDGSCAEERSVLVGFEEVQTPNGKVQRPIVSETYRPAACPQQP